MKEIKQLVIDGASPTLPTVTLSATTVVAGGTVTATIANGPGNAGDWVGAVWRQRRGRDVPRLEVSERDADQAGDRDDRRGGDVHDAGDAGHLQRAVLPERFVTKLATSATITVTAPAPPTITLSATTVVRRRDR